MAQKGIDMKLLERLVEAFGVSGSEDSVREMIRRAIKPYVNRIIVDKIGNLIAHKKGKGPKVMLAAHMDEVGLMTKRIDEKGLIYCTAVGGIVPAVMIGQKVHIKTKAGFIHGIITTKKVSAGKEIEELPKIEELVVDTGLGKKDLLKIGVEIGSYLSLEEEFGLLGNKDVIVGKALDDRVGCYILIELAKRLKKVKHDVYFVFTVQEEMGLYGARTSAFALEPDWGVVIDTTHANDLFHEPSRFLGKGPCITVKDGEFIANKNINLHLKKIAKEKKIPHQLEASEIGTTDATIISITKRGIPSTVVSVPIRNAHTNMSIAYKPDIQNTILLLEALLRNPPKI